MKFQQLVKDLQRAGAEAHETTRAYGLYYDGIQHGEIFPAVCARIDPYLIGTEEARERKKAVAEILKRYKTLDIECVIGKPYICYIITTKADKARGEELHAEAAVFLEAFHQHRHEALKAGADDPAGAVKAGQAAIEEWKQSPKYKEVS